jgi:hypothetical protein
MGKYYFESGDTEYVAANDNTTVIGTGADDEQIILAAGVEGVVADSTIERVDFVGDIADFQFQQGFGSNIDILDGSGNVIASVGSVDGKTLAFADGSVELGYADGTVSVGGTDITTTAATVVPETIDNTDVSEADAGDEETAPTFSVAASGDEVIEGNDGTFTVTLSEAQAAATTVDYAVSLGGGATAADHGDITVAGAVDNAGSGTLTFAAGETSKTITIPVTFDSQTETGETIAVTLSNAATGTEVGTASDSVALVDPPAPTFTITSDAVGGAATEEGQDITYTITPDGITDQAYTFTLSTLGDTLGGVATPARADDFSPASQTITFAAGQTTAETVTQTIVNDGATEGLEGYKTQLLDSSFAQVGDAISGLITDPTSGDGSGTTYTFTNAIDSFPGTTGNDTFIGDNSGAPIVQLSDQANGGLGTDTLKLYSTANVLPTITGIENLYFNNPGNGSDINVSGLSSVVAVELDNIEVSDADDGATESLTLAQGQSLTLDSVVDNDTGGHALEVNGGATFTSLDLTLDGAGNASTGGNALEVNFDDAAALATLNITTANNASRVAFTDDDNAIKTITVAGDQSVNLGTLTTNVNSFNASSMTAGGVTVDFGASGSNTIITGSAAGDTVTAGAAVNYTVDLGAGNDLLNANDAASRITIDDTFDGGDGTDTLVILAADAADLDDNDAADNAVLAKITNFEQLRITDQLDTADSFNIANLGYNYLQVAADVGTNTTITGFESGATIEMRNAANATADLVVGMTGATTAGTTEDVINLKLNANLTTNDTSYSYNFDLEGINIVNIESNDRVTSSNPDSDVPADGNEGYVVDLAGGTPGNSANINHVNITGAQQTSYTVNAATVGLEDVDGSDAIGNVIVNADAFAGTEGVTLKGGSGIDTLTGSNLGDVITGGAGNDTITGGAGADVMTGGAGNDTFNFAVVAGTTNDSTDGTAVVSASQFDTIMDWSVGDNKIAATIADDATNVALTIASNGGTAVAGTAAINAEGLAAFASSDDTLAERITAVEAGINAAGAPAAGQSAFFEFGSDSYVFISDGTDNVDTNDVLIKLAGVTGLTDSTIDANGDLAIV